MIFYGRIIQCIDQIQLQVKYYLVVHKIKPAIYERQENGYIKIKLPQNFIFIDRDENLFATYDNGELCIDCNIKCECNAKCECDSKCGIANQTSDCSDKNTLNNTFLRTQDIDYPDAIYIQAPNGLYVRPEPEYIASSLFKEGQSLDYISSHGAFRMGNFDQPSVEDHIGLYSTALGVNTTAADIANFSSGINSHASSQEITDIRLITIGITGNGASHALGIRNYATNTASFASGYGNTSSGVASSSEGCLNISSGSGSHVEGLQNIASGRGSHAQGIGTQSIGVGSHTEGLYTVAGNNGAHAEGEETKALSNGCHAEGVETVANAPAAHAEGYLCGAYGNVSHVQGIGNVVNNLVSHAQGWYNKANSDNSYVEGYENNVIHPGVHLMGVQCTSTASFTAFRYAPGPSGVANNLSTPNYSFQIGRNQVNAVIDTLGNYFGVSYNTRNADYAEMFEWKDQNINKEDRVGYFVQLVDGHLIEKHTGNNTPVGIVSHTAGVLGDSGNLTWNKQYLTDDFGRPLIEMDYYQAYVQELSYTDITINPDTYPKQSKALNKEDALALLSDLTEEQLDKLKDVHPIPRCILNPDYQKDILYIPRSQRNEWESIGLLGKIYVRDNGQCAIGGLCSAENGIAVPGSHWRVLQRISNNVIRILFTLSA